MRSARLDFAPTSSAQRARTQRPVVVSFSEYIETSWRWFEGQLAPGQLEWRFFHTTARNALERLERPRIGRYAEALRVRAFCARRPADLVVTHGPTLTHCYEEIARLKRPRTPHMAYAFNFPSLPRGLRAAAMRNAFQNVDRFLVYSTVEKHLYADYFKIPPGRIDMVHWAVSPPQPSAEARQRGTQPYVCAIGGNGRDYATLLQAARATPEIQYLCVARPENLRDLHVPPNVKVECNVPFQRACDITYNARFMVLPLNSSEVPCGHVTIVNAMHLEKALVVTDSRGVHDYAIEGETALRVTPRDAEAMAAAVRKLWDDSALCESMGKKAQAFAQANCSEEHTIAYLTRYFTQKGLLRTDAAQRTAVEDLAVQA